VLVGLADAISTRDVGLRAAWAPLDWFTVYPEVNSHLYGFKLDSTWLNVGLCCHREFGGRLSFVAQPRYTTNTKRHFVSLGLGAKVEALPTWMVGLEAEPVLAGRDATTRILAWGLAFEKEYGWHNFVVTVGSAHNQSAPGLFRSDGPASAYSDLLDIAKGHFRIGFNVLRKI
jgi:hypothetical protein